MMKRNLIAVVGCALALVSANCRLRSKRRIPTASRRDSLRTNLSYIASDALEGRGTPSHGLDLAADYIAAQFQRAGLEPAAGGSYFQSATFDQATVGPWRVSGCF